MQLKDGNDNIYPNVIREGTWTPTMDNANVTYTLRLGTYKKIGNMVFYNCRLRGTINSTTSPYYATISGLPFAPDTDYAGTLFEHLNCCVNNQNLLVRVSNSNNAGVIGLQRDNENAGGALAQWNTDLGTFYISITGFYFTD